MQPFRKERQNKPYKCFHCFKSFKSSNGLKYHSEREHSDELKMDIHYGTANEGHINVMSSKSRSIPQPLNLSPEVNLLTEFALIATSPQSPLVREVSGENVYVRRSGDDSPLPQLVDPKQMDYQTAQSRNVSQSICVHSPTKTSLCQTMPSSKWRCFISGTRVKFPDEDGRNWRTVDDTETEEVSDDMFQDGLRVDDVQRINLNFDENSDEFIVTFKSCNKEQSRLQVEITADYPFFLKDKDCWASLNPAVTELSYGLTCQTLQRSDVCLFPYDPDVVTYCRASDENSSEFTDMSMAALTLSSMAKDKEEHSHRRTKLLSKSHCPSSRLKRNGVHQFSKRPMNAFMLFAKKFRLEITQAHPGKDNRAISVILGDKWKAMKQEERKEYVIQAKILADEHKRINPDCWKRKRTSQGSSKISYRRP